MKLFNGLAFLRPIGEPRNKMTFLFICLGKFLPAKCHKLACLHPYLLWRDQPKNLFWKEYATLEHASSLIALTCIQRMHKGCHELVKGVSYPFL
jgi:hypothetical protein